jgi:hypothetical protein
MAAKRKAVGLLVALAALLLAAPAFASIPRSPLLDPPRLTIELDPPADVAQDERETPLHRAIASALTTPAPIRREPLETNLRRALAHALPASEPLASLAETRVRASDFFAPLFHQPPEPLSRALHQAYARLNGENASDRLFASGDPVNGRDPSGDEASSSNSGWIVATRRNGSIRRFSPKEIAENRNDVRQFLCIESGLQWHDAEALLLKVGSKEKNTALLQAAVTGGAKASGVYPLMAATAGAGIGGGVAGVVLAEAGVGGVAATALTGGAGGVGAQAGEDAANGHVSSAKQYGKSFAVGATVSVAVGGVVGVAGRAMGATPDVIPSIAPEEGWTPQSPDYVPLTGRTFQHYTNAAGAQGITGIEVTGLKVGQTVTVNQAKFGIGENDFLAQAHGDIFVTDIGVHASSGKLNQIGVFGDKQQFVIELREDEMFNQGIRVLGAHPDRGIYTIPGESTIHGTVFVTRVR